MLREAKKLASTLTRTAMSAAQSVARLALFVPWLASLLAALVCLGLARLLLLLVGTIPIPMNHPSDFVIVSKLTDKADKERQ